MTEWNEDFCKWKGYGTYLEVLVGGWGLVNIVLLGQVCLHLYYPHCCLGTSQRCWGATWLSLSSYASYSLIYYPTQASNCMKYRVVWAVFKVYIDGTHEFLGVLCASMWNLIMQLVLVAVATTMGHINLPWKYWDVNEIWSMRKSECNAMCLGWGGLSGNLNVWVDVLVGEMGHNALGFVAGCPPSSWLWVGCKYAPIYATSLHRCRIYNLLLMNHHISIHV